MIIIAIAIAIIIIISSSSTYLYYTIVLVFVLSSDRSLRRSQLPEIGKKKFLVPDSMVMGEFKRARRHFRLPDLGSPACSAPLAL